ncbi:hypothetical protein D3C72_942250 [compost metagenome]
MQAHVAVRSFLEQFVLKDFLRTQLVATMDQVHFPGDVRQIKCLLNRRIAAADYGDHLIAIEEAVTGRTGGNAFAGEGFFRGQAEILRRGAGGNDQCVAGVSAAVADKLERALLQLGGVDVVVNDLCGKAFGVFLHAFHQDRAGEAFDVTGPVVDLDGGGELATGLQAGDDHGFEVGAGGIHGSAVTGRAGAKDDQA